jgi:hypothetical protein
MGPLERFLLSSQAGHLEAFLDRMDITELLTIGKLNTRIHYLVESYASKTWDFVRFIETYIQRASRFLALLDGTTALVHGEAVLRFLMRCQAAVCPLYVCADISKIYHIQRLLEDDGFDLISPDPARPLHHSIRNLVHRSHHEDVGTWSLSGDRSSHVRPHKGYKFVYLKGIGPAVRTVVIRLVRNEPYRHALNAGIS